MSARARSLFALFLCALLCVPFSLLSLDASAEGIDESELDVGLNVYYYPTSGSYQLFYSVDAVDNGGSNFAGANFLDLGYIPERYFARLSVYSVPYTENVLFQKGDMVEMRIDSYSTIFALQNGTDIYYLTSVDSMRLRLAYVDGSYADVSLSASDYYYNKNTLMSYVLFNFEAEKDVSIIYVYFDFTLDNFSEMDENDLQIDDAAMLSFLTEVNASYEIQEETVGLLNSVVAWLKSIKENISDVFDSISELPEKLWQKISDGLKALFVPSEAEFEDIRDQWDNLLKSRFGALYEVSAIISDFAGGLTNMGEKNTIDFPSVTVNLVGTDFTFGGWTVKLVPDDMEFLTTISKAITSIVCTFLFVNALRRKYDSVMEGR